MVAKPKLMPLYELHRVVQRYGGQQVLEVPELVIDRGAITVLWGANGAGKSTLLRLLAFMEPPAEGEIRFSGVCVQRADRALRRSIGWLMQQPYLLQGSVLDNVMLGLKLHGIRRSLCRSLALAALEEVGFSADPKQPVQKLSGGQRQLVALARCLVLRPKVLLLDEPFNHLDRDARKRVEDLLARRVRSEGTSVVLTSHEPMLLADALVNLVAGRAVASAIRKRAVRVRCLAP